MDQAITPLLPVPGSPVISPQQVARLFAIAQVLGWTRTTLDLHFARFGYAHPRDIVVAHYDAIVSSLNQQRVAS